MGEKDILEKSLCAFNDVFADIVNTLVFNGMRRISEDSLENAIVHSAYHGSKAFRELERDIAKNWLDNDIRISLIGIENQSKAENDIPLRIIGYDGASYRDQIRYEKDNKGLRKKTVDACPVVTLVLYFGYTERWNKAKTVHEALGDKLLPELKPFVSDYKINIFEIAWLTPDQVKEFNSDFRYVADYFVQMRMTGTYIGSNEEMKHVREVLQLMSQLTGDDRFTNAIGEIDRNGQEGGIKTMRSAIDIYWEKGIEQGIEQGIEKGIEQGEDRHLVEQICKKLRRGKDVEQIADELEEDIVRVKLICEMAKEYYPDYDFDKVYKAVKEELLSVNV